MPAFVSRPTAMPNSSMDTPSTLATGAEYLKAIPRPVTLAALALAPWVIASTTRTASLAGSPKPLSAALTFEPISAKPVPVASAPRTIAARLSFIWSTDMPPRISSVANCATSSVVPLASMPTLSTATAIFS